MWYVQACPPLDFYLAGTQTISDYLEGAEEFLVSMDDEVGGKYETCSRGWSELVWAIRAYTQHPGFDGRLRHEPRVAYDAESDSHYFVFKQDANGTTFVVSKDFMPRVQDADPEEAIEVE